MVSIMIKREDLQNGKYVQTCDLDAEAPWRDWLGRPIFAGDTIVHPASGESGVVIEVPAFATENVSDRWLVDYGDGTVPSRLCLQIGDKGQAAKCVECKPTEATK